MSPGFLVSLRSTLHPVSLYSATRPCPPAQYLLLCTSAQYPLPPARVPYVPRCSPLPRLPLFNCVSGVYILYGDVSWSPYTVPPPSAPSTVSPASYPSAWYLLSVPCTSTRYPLPYPYPTLPPTPAPCTCTCVLCPSAWYPLPLSTLHGIGVSPAPLHGIPAPCTGVLCPVSLTSAHPSQQAGWLPSQEARRSL